MDHDETGIEVNGRLAETLREAGYSNVSMLQPAHKDWNEDLLLRQRISRREREEKTVGEEITSDKSEDEQCPALAQ